MMDVTSEAPTISIAPPPASAAPLSDRLGCALGATYGLGPCSGLRLRHRAARVGRIGLAHGNGRDRRDAALSVTRAGDGRAAPRWALGSLRARSRGLLPARRAGRAPRQESSPGALVPC